MNSSTFCSLFLGLILISQSPLYTNARGLGVVGGGLVDELCNPIDDKIACHNVLGSNPEAMKAKNYYKLAEDVLKMAIKKAVEGQNFLKGLAAATKSPALTQCANFDYDGVVGSFKSALGEIKKDPQTANYDAGVAHDGPDQCDRGMEAEHIVNPQVAALNRDIRLLSQMAYFATDKLDG